MRTDPLEWCVLTRRPADHPGNFSAVFKQWHNGTERQCDARHALDRGALPLPAASAVALHVLIRLRRCFMCEWC